MRRGPYVLPVTLLLSAVLLSCGGGGGGSSSNPTPCAAPVQTGTCANVAGTWTVNETVTLTCNGVLAGQGGTQSGSGPITISQTGCAVSFVAGPGLSRAGTVTNNSIQVCGALAIVNAPATASQNIINFSGTTPNANTINLTGNGSLVVSAAGQSGSCTATSTETFTR